MEDDVKGTDSLFDFNSLQTSKAVTALFLRVSLGQIPGFVSLMGMVTLRAYFFKVREIFHLLIHSSHVHNSQGWIMQKSGAWNSILVSHVSVRDTSTYTTICCLPGVLAGSWMGSRSKNSMPDTPLWDMGISGGNLTHCITTPAPYKEFGSVFW